MEFLYITDAILAVQSQKRRSPIPNYPHMPRGKVWIYCLCLFVCLYSYENKASGVKFCTVVKGHPGQGITHSGELCSPKSQKSNKSASLYIHTDICIFMWVYVYIRMYVCMYIFARNWDTRIMWAYVCIYTYVCPLLRHQDNLARQTCPQAMRSMGMCGYTAVPEDGRTCFIYDLGE